MGLNLLHHAEVLFRTDTAYQIAWVLVVVLGGAYFWAMWRYCGRHHTHQWKPVTNLGFKGGGWEEEQVCECRARRDVKYWPPPEHEK
jgi:hypothetical protein